MPSNAELHRQMDAAVNSGDVEAISGFMTDDVVNHMAGEGPFAGDYQGKEAFFEVFGKMMELTGGQFSVEHRDILESAERSVAISTVSATRDGKTFEGDIIDICRWRDGQVAEEWLVPFDQPAFDQFFS
jgi:uncharacterized protein